MKLAYKYKDIKTSNNLELLNFYLYILTKNRAICNGMFQYIGEMAERLKAPVLKTGNGATRS